MSRWRTLRMPVAVASFGTLVAACVELSGPQEDLSSVSPISVAWPSVVVNDVLRDVAGVEAPLHLDAYDGDGNVLTDATVQFIALDQGVSIDARGVVRGGPTASTTPVRIVAQVRSGEDVIQTPEIRVDVVPQPDSTNPSTDVTAATVDVEANDLSNRPLAPMAVKVISRASGAPLGVKSWLVRYEILREPDGVDGRRTVLFSDGGTPNATVSVDTTDGNGDAIRTLVLQRLALARAGVQNVRVLVTVGNTRPNHRATMFFITFPIDVKGTSNGP